MEELDCKNPVENEDEYAVAVHEDGDSKTILFISGPRRGTFAVLRSGDEGSGTRPPENVIPPEALFLPLRGQECYRALVIILSELDSGRISPDVIFRIAAAARKWRAHIGPLLDYW